MKKNTLADFIFKAEQIYPNKFDYSKANYINNKTKITIICPEHGEFEIRPDDFLTGVHNCQKCGSIKKANSLKETKKLNKLNYKTKEVLTQETFLEECFNLNKEIDYSKANYLNWSSPTTFICKKCKTEFQRTPNNFLHSPWCSMCKKEEEKIFLKERYIEQASKIHNDKYDYSKVDYKTKSTKATIVCPEHGEFFQSFDAHICKRQGCPKCGKNAKHSTEEFKKFAIKKYGDMYNYDKVNYKNLNSNVKIKCNKCNKYFKQSWWTHIILDYGCPNCNFIKSKGEEEILNFLVENNIQFQREYKFKNCKDIRELPFDFYLEDYNIVIEFQGEQHFKEFDFFGGKEGFEKIKKHDKIKRDFCSNNNIKEIEILYNENIHDKLKSILN